MATLQATKVLAALKKAKRVGRVEEGMTIDGCSLVLQNLSPEDYDAINQETADLEELEFIHAYQVAHLCRSLVEIGDQLQAEFCRNFYGKDIDIVLEEGAGRAAEGYSGEYLRVKLDHVKKGSRGIMRMKAGPCKEDRQCLAAAC